MNDNCHIVATASCGPLLGEEKELSSSFSKLRASRREKMANMRRGQPVVAIHTAATDNDDDEDRFSSKRHSYSSSSSSASASSLLSPLSRSGGFRDGVWCDEKADGFLDLKIDDYGSGILTSQQKQATSSIFDPLVPQVPILAPPPKAVAPIATASASAATVSVLATGVRVVDDPCCFVLPMDVDCIEMTKKSDFLETKSPLSFRFFEPRDIHEVVRIEDICFGEKAWSESAILSCTPSTGYHIFVCEQRYPDREGIVLGFVIYRFRERKQCVQIVNFGVAPEARGQGLGSVLLKQVFGHARSDPSVARLTLHVAEENKAAERLYKRFGFWRTLYCADYYAVGEHAWEMECVLRPSA